MESDQIYISYVATRARIYRQIDALRSEIDVCLEHYKQEAPTVADIARLEAFHAQRNELLQELQDQGERFIAYLVERLGRIQNP